MTCKICGSMYHEPSERIDVCEQCDEALLVLSSTIVYKDQLKGLIELGWQNRTADDKMREHNELKSEIKHLKQEIEKLKKEVL